MKLLQINVTGYIGSTGKITEAIGNIVQENGGTSLIAFGRIGKPGKSLYYKIGNRYDHISHAIQTRIFDTHGLCSTRETEKFITWIKGQAPDIIHLHNIHGYYLNYRVLFQFLKESKIPVIWTLHDCWPMTGHCAYFDAAGCPKWQTGCNSCPQKQAYPQSLVMDASRKNWLTKSHIFTSLDNLRLVSVSKWLESIVTRSYLNKYSCQTIYNGIDTSIFSPANPAAIDFVKKKFNIPKNGKVLLGVAYNWSERKGLSDYILLSKMLPDNIRIVLVGVDAANQKKLTSKMIALHKTDSVAELAVLYSIADIVLNLSVEESFGLTTVEGFSCGTPGIVYNKTASPELITKDTGIIVEKGNISDLYSAVLYLLEKGKSNYSSLCRRTALEKYDSKRNFSSYLELYQKTLRFHI